MADITQLEIILAQNTGDGTQAESISLPPGTVEQISSIGSSIDKNLMKMSQTALSLTVWDLDGQIFEWVTGISKVGAYGVIPPWIQVAIGDDCLYKGTVKVESMVWDPEKGTTKIQTEHWSKMLDYIIPKPVNRQIFNTTVGTQAVDMLGGWIPTDQIDRPDVYERAEYSYRSASFSSINWISLGDVVEVWLDYPGWDTTYKGMAKATRLYKMKDIAAFAVEFETQPGWTPYPDQDIRLWGNFYPAYTLRFFNRNLQESVPGWNISKAVVAGTEDNPSMRVTLNTTDGLTEGDKIKIYQFEGIITATVSTVDHQNKTLYLDTNIEKPLPVGTVVKLSEETMKEEVWVEARDLIQRVVKPGTGGDAAIAICPVDLSGFNPMTLGAPVWSWVMPSNLPKGNVARVFPYGDGLEIWMGSKAQSVPFRGDFISGQPWKNIPGMPFGGYRTAPWTDQFLSLPTPWNPITLTEPYDTLSDALRDWCGAWDTSIPSPASTFLYWSIGDYRFNSIATCSCTFKPPKNPRTQTLYDNTTDGIDLLSSYLILDGKNIPITNDGFQSGLFWDANTFVVSTWKGKTGIVTKSGSTWTLGNLEFKTSSLGKYATLRHTPWGPIAFGNKGFCFITVVGGAINFGEIWNIQSAGIKTISKEDDFIDSNIVNMILTQPKEAIIIAECIHYPYGKWPSLELSTSITPKSEDLKDIKITTQLIKVKLLPASETQEWQTETLCNTKVPGGSVQMHRNPGGGSVGIMGGKAWVWRSESSTLIPRIKVGGATASSIIESLCGINGIVPIARGDGWLEFRSRPIPGKSWIKRSIDPMVLDSTTAAMSDTHISIARVSGKDDSTKATVSRTTDLNGFEFYLGGELEFKNDYIRSASHAHAVGEILLASWGEPRKTKSQKWFWPDWDPKLGLMDIVSLPDPTPLNPKARSNWMITRMDWGLGDQTLSVDLVEALGAQTP